VNIEGYCSVCSIDQIAKNQFNLDVSQYVVEKLTQTIRLDIDASKRELDEIQNTKSDLYELMRSNLEKILEGRT